MPIAQTKALAGAITGTPCSVVGEMSTNRSKIPLGSIVVNSAVRHKCGTSEKMLSQFRKLTDRVGGGIKCFLLTGPFV